MIFCSGCFQNTEIKSIIDERGTVGVCPVCGSKEVAIYNTERDSTLVGIFDNLLSIYTAEDDLPRDYPEGERRLLVDVIKNEWDIFSQIPDECILSILKSLSPTLWEDYPVVFEKTPNLHDLDAVVFKKGKSPNTVALTLRASLKPVILAAPQ